MEKIRHLLVADTSAMDLNKTRGSNLLRSPVPCPESPPLPSVSADGKARVDKLIEQVDGIFLTDKVLNSKAQEPYLSWCSEARLQKDIVDYAVERLHIYWLSSRPAVMKAAIFLCANWMVEIDGQKLRSLLLVCLQKDFESRQDMQTKSPEKYLNSVAFLIAIYSRVRIEKLPLDFLIVPIFQYLEDLLTGDDSEIELFAQLFVDLGSTLHEAQVENGKYASLKLFNPLQNLLVKVRSTLMSRNLSSQSRLWLLFVMDMSSGGDYQLPSSSLQLFYKNVDNLGKSAELLLKSLETIGTSKESGDTDLTLPSKDLNIHVNQQINQKISEIEISSDCSDSNTTQRTNSIGSKKNSPGKNGNVDKRENFRSAMGLDKGAKGKSYWLHDDRFEKEDSEKEKSTDSFSKPRASQGNWRRPTTPKEEEDGKAQKIDSNWRESKTNNLQVKRNVKENARQLQPTAPPLEEEYWA